MIELHGDVEQKGRVGLGMLLAGLTVFLMALILLLGNMRLYELRQSNARLEQELSERRKAVSERGGDEEWLQQARALGLRQADPDQTVVLYLR